MQFTETMKYKDKWHNQRLRINLSKFSRFILNICFIQIQFDRFIELLIQKCNLDLSLRLVRTLKIADYLNSQMTFI